MATKLDKPLIRDTGLMNDGKEVLVMLLPSDTGGTLVFKGKGKHGAGKEIPLSKIYDNQESFSEVDGVEPVGLSKTGFITGLEEFDTITMSKLETRLMILGPEIMTDELKCKIWKVIRDIREDERADLGMRPIGDTRRGQEV